MDDVAVAEEGVEGVVEEDVEVGMGEGWTSTEYQDLEQTDLFLIL